MDEGKLAGAVTLVARRGKVVYFDAVANLYTGATMEKDSLMRIYSMSKPITAVATMMLYHAMVLQRRRGREQRRGRTHQRPTVR